MKIYILIISLFFSKIILSQDIEVGLPIDISISEKKESIIINIRDSIDGVNVENEPIDKLNYSQTIIELKNDSIIKIEFVFPAGGFLPVNKDNSTVKNQIVKMKLNKKNIELFISFDMDSYGPKMYYLKGYFKIKKNGDYTKFIPSEFNLIRSGKNERCYYFDKTGSKLFTSDVLRGKFVYGSR